jgi:hypothetical protein
MVVFCELKNSWILLSALTLVPEHIGRWEMVFHLEEGPWVVELGASDTGIRVGSHLKIVDLVFEYRRLGGDHYFMGHPSLGAIDNNQVGELPRNKGAGES